MKYYLIAVLDSQKPEIPEHLYCQLDAVSIKDLTLLYSQVSDQSDWLNFQNVEQHPAILHNQIMEELMQKCTILPFSFPTLLTAKVSLEDIFAPHYQELKTKLKALHQKVEYSLKLQMPIPKPSDEQQPNIFANKSTSAHQYMMQRYKAYQQKQQAIRQATTYYEHLIHQLSDFVLNHKVQYLPKPNINLQSYFLIEAKYQNDFKKKLEQEIQIKPDYHFLISGPWACYNFTNLQLKL